MLIRLREERGIAMIVALLVAMAVLMLSTAVIAQSIHSVDSSGYDRERLLSVNIAESGTNTWWAYLQTTPAASISCTAKTATVSSGPSDGEYTATATFYASDATTTMTCPFTSSSYPTYARITSKGTISGQTPRTMETFVKLTPVRSGFGSAIMSNAATTFSNNFDVYGQTGNDGDIYVLNGNLSISNAPEIRGNVYVPYGGVTQFNGSTIYGSLLARDSITINNPAVVKGNVASDLGTLAGSGTIEGNASAGSTIASSLTVGGTKTPNTDVPTTPTQTFPVIGYVASDWTNAGYSIIDSTIYGSSAGATNCAKAYTWMRSSWAASAYTNIVLLINSGTACTFANGNNDVNTIKGDVAIISSWGFDLSQRSSWNGVSGAVKKMHFISTAPAASCPASGTTNKNIVVGNNTSFDAFTNVLFYTPCTATMSNQNNFSGQVMASNVTINNLFTMTYTPVLVPGVGTITSFEQDIAYVREVPSS